MQKITNTSNKLDNIAGFTFIGDPGCDGLGVEIMSIFNAACHEAAGDFLLIGGDIVPNGTNRFYQNMVEMTGKSISKPIYMLAGNHDTMDYENFFGKKNYYLYDENLLLVVLDDSKRVFAEESLEMLKEALENDRDNIILAFHIPPPNKVCANSIKTEEWEKVLGIIRPVKGKVKYILCGHVHSYFEDDLDGIRLISTGGGGARIEEVPGVPEPYYHFVELSFDQSGKLGHEVKQVEFNKAPVLAKEVQKAMESAFEGECMAHLRYRLYAEDAARNNKPGLAKLFYAASDSEFYHARNFYYAMNGLKSSPHAVAESIAGENAEVEKIYPEGKKTANFHGAGLAAYAFDDARAAESIHLRLFREAEKIVETGADIPEREYFTCTSCGYTIAGENSNNPCPVCGAPPDKIKSVGK